MARRIEEYSIQVILDLKVYGKINLRREIG
jgi:hypothetical protein